jgi:hypothetical protein
MLGAGSRREARIFWSQGRLFDARHRIALRSQETISLQSVMPGLVPGIHEFPPGIKDVDGRDKPGHDGKL